MHICESLSFSLRFFVQLQKRGEAVFVLETVGFADDCVPGEADGGARLADSGENRLFDTNEVYVLLAIESGAVGDARGVVERDHADIIANFVLSRPADEGIER